MPNRALISAAMALALLCAACAVPNRSLPAAAAPDHPRFPRTATAEEEAAFALAGSIGVFANAIDTSGPWGPLVTRLLDEKAPGGIARRLRTVSGRAVAAPAGTAVIGRDPDGGSTEVAAVLGEVRGRPGGDGACKVVLAILSETALDADGVGRVLGEAANPWTLWYGVARLQAPAVGQHSLVCPAGDGTLQAYQIQFMGGVSGVRLFRVGGTADRPELVRPLFAFAPGPVAAEDLQVTERRFRPLAGLSSLDVWGIAGRSGPVRAASGMAPKMD